MASALEQRNINFDAGHEIFIICLLGLTPGANAMHSFASNIPTQSHDVVIPATAGLVVRSRWRLVTASFIAVFCLFSLIMYPAVVIAFRELEYKTKP